MPSLISVLMPVKNAGLYLVDCLDSIVAQSYRHWELLAIDDSSDDDSRDILNSYASRDDRIKVFSNEGNGIIHALRLAYKKSSGTLVTRMDADDIMSSNKLEVLKTKIKDTGRGNIAVGGVEYFSEGELGEGYLKYAQWLNELSTKGDNYSEIYKECVIPSPCWMLYRTDLDLIGAFENDVYPEDYDLCYRMYQNKLNVIPNDKILHRWRDHTQRSSRRLPEYADNSFLDIKLYYFIEIDHDSEKELVIWGAGKKGKKIAKLLLARNQPFIWVCENDKKIGKDIYSQILRPPESLKKSQSYQFIILVANEVEQKEILNHSIIRGNKTFMFC